MQNITVSVKGNVATIVIDLSKNLGPSKTGKTEMVATTHGNVNIPGSDVTLGLNAYRRKAA